MAMPMAAKTALLFFDWPAVAPILAPLRHPGLHSHLLKVIIMLEKKAFLPVSSYFKEPNPKIPWEDKQMMVQTETEPFPERQEPVFFGINSFGFGGANGHCIVQEYKGAQNEDW